MLSLPLVYTILALIAYTSSFWYLFIHLMTKRTPNQWFVGLTALVGPVSYTHLTLPTNREG